MCANGVPFGEDFLAEIGLPAPDPETPGNPGETPDPAPVYVVFGVSEDDMLQGKILQAGGMPYDAALAVSLTITAIIVLYNLSGGIFFILTPLRNKETAHE